MAPGRIRIHGDPLLPKWAITVAICKGHGPRSARDDASLQESAATQQGDEGAVPIYQEDGKQEKTTASRVLRRTARSQTSAARDTLRLQRAANAARRMHFLRMHFLRCICQHHKHGFALAPSTRHPPLNDPMHQYLQPSTESRCPTLAYPWLGSGALL